LFEQYRVPTQRLYVISLRPSSLCVVAATGQTYSHGAFSQCWHIIGWNVACGFSSAEASPQPVPKYASIRSQCIARWRSTWSLPTTGMLFSLWQATTHALQPMHAV
jgi:hypothetical protein